MQFSHQDYQILITLIGDNTEQEICTFNESVAENATYSGKQGMNTFTRFHAVSPRGKIYHASISYPGCMNDQQTSHLVKLEKRIDQDEGYMVDSGYSGITGDNIIRKRSGKLSANDKEWNLKIDKMRVVIENHFCYMKKWHILSDPFRMKLTKKNDLDHIFQVHHEYWMIACALYNEFGPPLRN